MNTPCPDLLTKEMETWLNEQHAPAVITTAKMVVEFMKKFGLTSEQTGELLLQYVEKVR